MYPKNICVYCGSSSQVDARFFEEARLFGQILAKHEIELVYGAGGLGIMGVLSDTVLENKGKVVGVIPQFMIDAGWNNSKFTHLIVTSDMHERKQKMSEISDAAVALPGGIGTFEELFEILTWKQLGLVVKPIIIVNIDGYFDHLIAMLELAVEKKFMREIHKKMWIEVKSVSEILDAIANSPTWDISARKIAAI